MLTRDAVAPSQATLRPLKAVKTATFPVYSDLTDRLLAAANHPDDTVAHVMSTCSAYAYADEHTVAMIMARMGLVDNRCRMIAQLVDAMFIDSTAFLVQSADGKVAILAYRGTEPLNFISWLTDANVYPESVAIPFPGGAGPFDVHGGFYRNTRATRYEVITALNRAVEGESVIAEGVRMPNPLEALYITGHSLGGAMAALMATMLVTQPAYAPIAATLRAVYTFGQPMIGSHEFAQACEADARIGGRVIRYVYEHDVVPHLPPNDSGAFAHFGREFRYGGHWPWDEHGATEQAGNLVELLEAPIAFVARQLPMLRKLPFRYSLDDHNPHHYLSAATPPGMCTEFGDHDLVS